eukprot:1493132-Alexandrium_andersonii.AAC.1
MSASLVGSEMCIRDSPRRAPPEAPCAGSALLGGSGGGGSPSREGAQATCLLYTSDAADDM